MPELPEVETMRRGITPVIGARIADVKRIRSRHRPLVISPAARSFRRRAIGTTIAGVDRIGKRVVLQLDNHEAIVFEPRMTGLVLLTDPPDRDHLRLTIDLTDARPRQLFYWDRRGLGHIDLLSAAELAQRFAPDRIGPDALDVTARQLANRLASSRREIKVALLDQRSVAGIGNLYASEILHLARIHPAIGCSALTGDQWRALHRAMRRVLNAAIRHEGSTLRDGTYRNALNVAGGYQNHHRVYDRANLPCPVCHRRVVRIVQAQRSTFFCPRCQGPRQTESASPVRRRESGNIAPTR